MRDYPTKIWALAAVLQDLGTIKLPIAVVLQCCRAASSRYPVAKQENHRDPSSYDCCTAAVKLSVSMNSTCSLN